MTGCTKKRDRRDRVEPRREADHVRAFSLEAEAALIRRRLARHHLDGPIPTEHDACRHGDDET